MPINRYATVAGRQFETDAMKWLREQGFDVERLRLTGTEDEGDLLIRGFQSPVADRLVIETKREKGFRLGPWVKEAQVESLNYRMHRGLSHYPGFVVVHHARGKGISGAYVTTTLSEYIRHIR